MSDEKVPPSETATLAVTAEEIKLNGSKEDIDHVAGDRDPNCMNDDVKIRFEDIIGEPDPEVYSLDTVWLLSFKVFTQTKLWCYRITSILLALPCSLVWGVWFACLAFCRIWCCVPFLRSCDIEFACIRRIIEITLQTCCAPFFEAVGKVFSGVRIRLEKSASF